MKLNEKKKKLHSQNPYFYIVNTMRQSLTFISPAYVHLKIYLTLYTMWCLGKQERKQVSKVAIQCFLLLFKVHSVIAPGSQPPLPGRLVWQCYLCVWRQVPWQPGRAGYPGRGWSLRFGTCWPESGPNLRKRQKESN